MASSRYPSQGVAPEARGRGGVLVKSGKAKGYYYPLTDYASHKLGFGATNPLTQALQRNGHK